MGASIKIINAEYGVAFCPKEDIPLYILKYCKAENVNIFYLHQRDWLVLNEGNPNFERLKELTLLYLELDNQARSKITDESMKMGMRFFTFLNEIIRIQKNCAKKEDGLKQHNDNQNIIRNGRCSFYIKIFSHRCNTGERSIY